MLDYEEMFRALREEGQIKSLRELEETNQLTPEIRYIWDVMKKETFLMSMDVKKIQSFDKYVNFLYNHKS